MTIGKLMTVALLGALVGCASGGKPPCVFAKVGDAADYVHLNSHFPKAFEFLQRKDLSTLPVGRYEIDGDNCWASIQDAKLTPLTADSKVEVHGKYIDVQVPLSGDETYGFLVLDEPKTLPQGRDVLLFNAVTTPRTVHPGEFAIFFPPYGAHAPNHTAGEPRTIRKLVIKVKAD